MPFNMPFLFFYRIQSFKLPFFKGLEFIDWVDYSNSTIVRITKGWYQKSTYI